MNNIQIFNNNEFGNVRVVQINNMPYFVGKDVAEILGYARPKDAISTHCKGAVKYSIPTNGGKQAVLCIPESDLYKLIFRSKLPNAEQFTDWVTSEVLPTIRKTGMFITDDLFTELMNNPIKFGEMLIDYGNLKKENQQQQQELLINRPKAKYYDTILQSTSVMPISLIAKDYGMSAIAFNKLLNEHKIQYKQSGTWLLYNKYADKGYTQSKTSEYTTSTGEIKTSIHTYWTQKGRLFLYDFLKEHNILPVIEIEADLKI